MYNFLKNYVKDVLTPTRHNLQLKKYFSTNQIYSIIEYN